MVLGVPYHGTDSSENSEENSEGAPPLSPLCKVDQDQSADSAGADTSEAATAAGVAVLGGEGCGKWDFMLRSPAKKPANAVASARAVVAEPAGKRLPLCCHEKAGMGAVKKGCYCCDADKNQVDESIGVFAMEF